MLRLRRAAAVAAARWAGASIGGGVAGLFGGAAGGLILAAAPESTASLAVVPVLAVVGGCCGAAAGAGVGAGLSVAESIARSRRAIALVCGAAIGGGLAGSCRAVARPMESRRAGRREHRRRWRCRGARDWRGGGTRLQPDDVGLRRGAGSAARPPATRCRRSDRRGLRASGPGAGACGPPSGRRHHSSHRRIILRIAGNLDRPRPVHRRTELRSADRGLVSTGEGALFGLGLALGLDATTVNQRTLTSRRPIHRRRIAGLFFRLTAKARRREAFEEPCVLASSR